MPFKIAMKFYSAKTKFFIFIILILILNAHSVVSQQFEWAASASNVDLAYHFSSTDSKGNIAVAGESSFHSSIHRGMPEIYDGTGSRIKQNEYFREGFVIICYSSSGKALWNKAIDRGTGYLWGIAFNGNDELVVLMSLYERMVDEDGKKVGRIPQLLGYDWYEAGHYLASINANGEVSKLQKVGFSPGKIEISDFQYHPGGGFVLAGFADPGVVVYGFEEKAGPSGGDVVVFMNDTGKVEWVSIASFTANSCCSWYTKWNNLAIAPNGTIYAGNTMRQGVTFSNSDIELDATPNSDQEEPKRWHEMYVASFKPNGELNWAKKAGFKSRFSSIAANNEGVAVGLMLYEGHTVFGLEVDTTHHNIMCMAGLNNKGKTQWATSTGIDQSCDMEFDYNGDLYVLGTFRELHPWAQRSGAIETDTIPDRHSLIISKWNKKGEYQWFKSANVPLETKNSPLALEMDNCGNMTIIGALWFVLPSNLVWWDKAFVSAQGYGGAPLISRFKNTIPDELLNTFFAADTVKLKDSSMAQTEPFINDTFKQSFSCKISPGPWKLGAFPNPFRNNATITYQLTYADNATLEVYDISGKLVETLFAQKEHLAGSYTVRLSRPLSAGTYVFKLTGTEAFASLRIVAQ